MVPKHIFHFDRYGRPVVRQKTLYHRMTAKAKAIFLTFAKLWPKHFRHQEAKELTGCDHFTDIISREMQYWPEDPEGRPQFDRPGRPYGGDGYGFPERASGHNQDRGGGFGPRIR